MLYIGIDLGTSAVKLLLMDEEGHIKNTISKEYPLEFPQPGWSQQNPEDWKKAVLGGIPELLASFDKSQVAAHRRRRPDAWSWWCWMRTIR